MVPMHNALAFCRTHTLSSGPLLASGTLNLQGNMT